jgi:hypothetical protein
VRCMQLAVKSVTGGLFTASRHCSMSVKTVESSPKVVHQSAVLGLYIPPKEIIRRI